MGSRKENFRGMKGVCVLMEEEQADMVYDVQKEVCEDRA